MDDERREAPESDFLSYNSDNVVNSTEFIALSAFEGPYGEDRLDVVVNIVRNTMANYEKEDRERALDNYEKQMLAYVAKKADYDQGTGGTLKVFGVLSDDAYPEEIQKLKPAEPTFFKWPLISADRVKMTIFPEAKDRPKAVKFYVKYDS